MTIFSVRKIATNDIGYQFPLTNAHLLKSEEPDEWKASAICKGEAEVGRYSIWPNRFLHMESRIMATVFDHFVNERGMVFPALC